MKFNSFSAVCCLALGAIAGANVAQAAPTPVKSVTLARRFPTAKSDATRVFKPGDRTFHAVVNLASASSHDKIKAVWIIADAGGVKNYRFAEKTLGVGKMDTLHFATSFKRDWPRGKYRLDVFCNGTRAGQEYFEVR
jgi:hypothetical protein